MVTLKFNGQTLSEVMTVSREKYVTHQISESLKKIKVLQSTQVGMKQG
jgi:hypothetical protein